MTHKEMERYQRQTMLAEIGEEGQRRLLGSSALVVGLGGLGAPVAAYLTGAGVGHIGLADSDAVSLTNLQRQILYSEPQLEMPKTEAALERLSALSSDVRFTLHPEGFIPGNALELAGAYDVIIDCCDNFATRFLIDDACAAAGKPWIHGSIGEFHGQVAVFNHKLGRRYAELYPDREELCALPRRTAGVLGAVPGVIGALEAAQAIKLLAGFGDLAEGTLFTIDLLTLETSLLKF